MYIDEGKILSMKYFQLTDAKDLRNPMFLEASSCWNWWAGSKYNNPQKDEEWVADEIQEIEQRLYLPNFPNMKYDISSCCRVRRRDDWKNVVYLPMSFTEIGVHCAKAFLNFWAVKFPPQDPNLYQDMPFLYANEVYRDQKDNNGDTHNGWFGWINTGDRDRLFDIRNMIYICGYNPLANNTGVDKYFSFSDNLEPEWRWINTGNLITGIGQIINGQVI